MRARETSYKNEKALIIYITEEERGSGEIIGKINECKTIYKNISIFVSGKNDVRKVLQQIINSKAQREHLHCCNL